MFGIILFSVGLSLLSPTTPAASHAALAFRQSGDTITRHVVGLLKFSVNHPATLSALETSADRFQEPSIPTATTPFRWIALKTHKEYVLNIFGLEGDHRARLKIVMFRSHACPRCRYLYHRLQRDMRNNRLHNADLYEINTHTHTGQDLAQLMGVHKVPTFILYSNGEDLYHGSDVYTNAVFRKEVLRAKVNVNDE